jgi:hypothetical protein
LPYLGSLLKQLAAELVHLPLEHIDVGHRRLEDVQLPLEVIELDLEHANLVKAVPVVDLALGQGALLDLDFLIQERQLVITPEGRSGVGVCECGKQERKEKALSRTGKATACCGSSGPIS